MQQGGLDADVTWTSLEASLHATSDGFQRASVVADGLKGSVTGADPSPIDFSTQHLELHARPTRAASRPTVPSTSARVRQAAVPMLDPVLGRHRAGGPRARRHRDPGGGFPHPHPGAGARALARGGGTVEITSLAAEKGSRRLRAQGVLALDELHRPSGQLDVRTAGLEQVIAR